MAVQEEKLIDAFYREILFYKIYSLKNFIIQN